jgi:nucleotide-binding universal stress UspA family protein
MKFLVPVDGSAASQRALHHALSLGRLFPQAEIVLLNVQNRESLGLSDIDAQDADALAAGASQKVLRKATADCQAAKVTVETRAELGPISETIIRVAREVAADQVVMGTRGLGRLRGLVLGSVATCVVQQADVPVTLVK